jgi:hypothetical protein
LECRYSLNRTESVPSTWRKTRTHAAAYGKSGGQSLIAASERELRTVSRDKIDDSRAVDCPVGTDFVPEMVKSSNDWGPCDGVLLALVDGIALSNHLAFHFIMQSGGISLLHREFA